MSDDLVAWLTAQIDEDERVARDPNWWKRPHGPGCAIGADCAPECDCDYAGQVLREIAAKRRRLERHKSSEDVLHGVICGWCSVPSLSVYQEWPCPDIRDDASVYAERRGYRSEWAPR